MKPSTDNIIFGTTVKMTFAVAALIGVFAAPTHAGQSDWTGACTFMIAGKPGACDKSMRLLIDDNNGLQFISNYQLPGVPWTTFSLIGNQKTPEVTFVTFLEADGTDGAFPASGLCNASLIESKISISCSVHVTVNMSMAPIALEWTYSGSRGAP